tara:strand:+ start:371 stop:586 length:216 start_codon:yes stop_codon:yes gene_type:complete
VNKKIKKTRALVGWNTGQRVHRPKKGMGSYNREMVKRQDGSLQNNNRRFDSLHPLHFSTLHSERATAVLEK